MAAGHNTLKVAQRNKLIYVLVLILSTFVRISSTAQTFDGPAELPRVYINSSVAATPSPGTVWVPAVTFASLQANVNAAACGDVIPVQAGVVLNGTLTLPVKPCDDLHWVTIETTALASLPPEGIRLTPCYAGVKSLPGRPAYPCATPIQATAAIVGNPPVVSHGSVNHYRFIGIEFAQPAGVYAYTLLSFQDTPDHIIVDRCWIHGNATDNTQRGTVFNGSYMAIIDSTITDIHRVGDDSQGIGGWTGTGPFKITNNFVEGGASSFGFGGAASATVPADIEIRGNHLFKPLSWDMHDPSYLGFKFNAKIALESKNSNRVLIEGNILENTWGGAQGGDGGAVWLGPKNQNNGCPVCDVSDITFRYNVIRHTGGGVYVFDSPSDAGGIAQQAQRYSIHDNFMYDVDKKYCNGTNALGIPFRFAGGIQYAPPTNILVKNNTALTVGDALLKIDVDPSVPMDSLTFENNIVLHGTYGIAGCKGRYLGAVLNTCATNLTFSGNTIIGPNEPSLPLGNTFIEGSSTQSVTKMTQYMSTSN